MTFGRAYCQYPVCGSSRASFLSGLYPKSPERVETLKEMRELLADAEKKAAAERKR